MDSTVKPFDKNAPLSLCRAFASLGGSYTIGAIRLCDSSYLLLRCRYPEGAGQQSGDLCGSRLSDFANVAAGVDYDVGFEFPVGARRSKDWLVTVAYEPDGNYTVWLTARTGQEWQVLAVKRGIVHTSLLDTVVRVYEAALGQPVR